MLSFEARGALKAGPGCAVVVEDLFSLRRAVAVRAVFWMCEQCFLEDSWYLKGEMESTVLENTNTFVKVQSLS